MSNFVKYMSPTHIIGINIAMYTIPFGRVSLAVEYAATGEDLPGQSHVFNSEEDAQDWYDALPGRGLGRLMNAIDMLSDV